MTRPSTPLPGHARRLAVCRKALGIPLGMVTVYAGLMLALAFLGRGAPAWMVFFWSLALVGLGGGLFCLYRHQRVARWAAVGVVLVLAGVLTAFPLTPFLSYALQALGLTGLSLVFYDLEKYAGIPLMFPGGLFFMAVVATVLNTPFTALAGLLLLLVASGLALARM